MNIKEFAYSGKIYHNLSVDELMEKSVERKEGVVTNTGALLVVNAPVHCRGRSAQDKYFVQDPSIDSKIEWNKGNVPISKEHYERIKAKIFAYLAAKKELFVFDGYVGALEEHRIRVRTINTHSSQSLAARHLFIRPQNGQDLGEPDFTVICAPDYRVELEDRVQGREKSEAMILIDVKNQLVIIVGTPYDGEMKKSVFTFLNYVYMEKDNVLPMHASASLTEKGECVIFCGLSGTGKSTLSARGMTVVADDELGWDKDKGIFNFEGGVFPKTEALDISQEPELFKGIRDGAVVLNVPVGDKENGKPVLDFKNPYLTEEEKAKNIVTSNGRVTLPLDNLPKTVQSGKAERPHIIFFLTMDVFGVLPPLSVIKDPKMIKYLFLSGYTAKAPGTEVGGKAAEPTTTFSALFGSPFFPRPIKIYADRLMELVEAHETKVFLLNTGWSGGKFGVGKRMSLNKVTIPLRDAAMNGTLDLSDSNLVEHPIFKGLLVPKSAPGVDAHILDPKQSWPEASRGEYDAVAQSLVEKFKENAQKKGFADLAS